MENHHFYWEDPLFLWPFSIAFCLFTRGYLQKKTFVPGKKMPGPLPDQREHGGKNAWRSAIEGWEHPTMWP